MTTLLIMISRKKKTYIFKSGWWSSHWFVACWRLTTYSVWMNWCWGTGWGHWWVQRCRWRWLLWICNQVYIKLKRNMFLCKTHYRGVVVITTAQLHSTKPELRFCAGSNPARGVSEIRDGEDLWQWSRLEIRLNAFRRSAIPQKQCIIFIIDVYLSFSNCEKYCLQNCFSMIWWMNSDKKNMGLNFWCFWSNAARFPWTFVEILWSVRIKLWT